MGFSATEAAFEGFRLARRHPLAILIWALVVFMFSLAMTGVLVALAGPALVEMTALNQQTTAGETADPAAVMALMGTLLPAYAMMFLVGLVYYAVMLPAVERAVLTPEKKAFGFLQLGDVELRHLGMILLLGLLTFGIYMLVAIVIGILIAAVSALAGAAVGIILGIVAGLGGLVLLLWVFSRFSLAGPVALREGGIGLKRSWALTKAKTWPVAGGLILCCVLAAVVAILIFAIFAGGVAAVGMGSSLGAMFQPDMSSAAAYFSPFMLAYTFVSSISSALGFAIMVGYGANVYDQLVGPGTSATATTAH